MGTLLSNNSKEPKTEKGNRLYEFRRVQSEELKQYRIPVYIMLPHYPYTFPDLIKEISTYFSDNYTDFD